ncbi:hypothetical protein OJ997_28850 [Solirubrobacter phytolaccae]|uniref:Uncharacterized protein n=1 Tax=Solirubrobacter phytolaccae TaxID=1404360 RepID=A0A9X3NDD4_9ACTN|nr:hypothetical protein [Solirubrobacter phytolaccae]MDA0184348.1 hypothetical protein [Solirubrobacter phytolaccae]
MVENHDRLNSGARPVDLRAVERNVSAQPTSLARRLAASITLLGGCAFALVAPFAVVMACEDRRDACGQSWQSDGLVWLSFVVAVASLCLALVAWNGRWWKTSGAAASVLVLGTLSWAVLSREVPELRVAEGPWLLILALDALAVTTALLTASHARGGHLRADAPGG